MLRVFISSTSVDLKPYRAAVQEATLSLSLHPVMMEYFTSMDANALDACRQKVQNCDLFIGIYAHRYGYIPDGQSKSITELEYEWAIRAKMPVYIFVIEPSYTWSDEYRDTDEAPLNAFKNRVGQQRVWSTFTTPDTLAAKVTQCLVQDPKVLHQEESSDISSRLRGFLSIAVALVVLAVLGVFIISALQGNKPSEAGPGTALAIHATETVPVLPSESPATDVTPTEVPATEVPATEMPVLAPTPECPGFNLVSRAVKGMTVRLTAGPPNKVNTKPMKPSLHPADSSTITEIKAGETFTIIDGAVCADNVLWWEVNYQGKYGWTGEGTGVEYWFEPDTN